MKLTKHLRQAHERFTPCVIAIVLSCLFVAACGDTSLEYLDGPVIVVATDSTGNVVLRDMVGGVQTLPHYYSNAQAIAASYQPGDTLH